MKPLKLSRPLVVLVVGLPGAGKSFFARQFAETFSAPLISTDHLRHVLFETPTYSRQEQELVKQLADMQLHELLKTNQTIVVDGGHNSLTDRRQSAAIAKKQGYDCLTVWVQTDEESAHVRSTKRNPQRPDDMYSPSLVSEQYETLARRFTPPKNERHVVISGKHSFSSQAKMVLRKLAATHTEEVEQAQTQQQNRHTRLSSPDRQRSTPDRPTPPRRNITIIR